MRDQHGPDRGSDRSSGTSVLQPGTAIPGKSTLIEATLRQSDVLVQRRATEGADQNSARVHATAERGLAGATEPLPHGTTIQRLFGRHDISGVKSQVGGPAAEACRDIGAEAYASQGGVAFAQTPNLHTTAHEAAHVVQQRAGVQLKGGVGNANDHYEQHADAVADRVVRGESAESLLDEHAPTRSEHGTSSRGDACPSCGTAKAAAGCENCAAKPGVVQRQEAANSGGAGPGACRETDRRAGLQHEAIQAHYKSFVDSTGAREYAIPSGSVSGNIGYADIASLGTGAIYEIKPYIPTEIASGLVQVATYVAGALANCGVPPPWHPGTAYPDTVIPFGDQELVAKQYGHPGLILYNVRNKRRQLQYDKVFEILVLLGLSLALLPTIAAAVLDPEPATKLALAGLSVAMIAILLDKLGMGDQERPSA
jgi:hypothetical protein